MKFISIPLYNFALSLYACGIRIASPFNEKAKKWIYSRASVWNELAQLPSHPNRIWVHCSSLGEYEQALPLIEKLQLNSEILITFFSPSGYEIVKKKNPSALVFYLPVDSKSNAERFLKIVQPKLAVFVRYDLWYYYLSAVQKNNTPSILISAVFREENIFFQWYGSLFKSMLHCFTHIFVQDENSKGVLLKNGFHNVTKAGDTRVDRVAAFVNDGRQFPLIEKFKGEKKLLIVGSLEPKDETVVLPLINDAEFSKHFKCIIAPHHIEKIYVEKIQAALHQKSVCYSSLLPQFAEECDLIIIDSIGMLSCMYAYADVAYIGGGFGEGLHNMLEPAVWGAPVFIGPQHQKFIEAIELVKCGGAFVVRDSDELKNKTFHLFTNNAAHQKAAQAANSFIQERKGATEVILNKIGSFPTRR